MAKDAFIWQHDPQGLVHSVKRARGIGEVEYHCGQTGPVKGKEKVRPEDHFCIDCSEADVEHDYPRSAWGVEGRTDGLREVP